MIETFIEFVDRSIANRQTHSYDPTIVDLLSSVSLHDHPESLSAQELNQNLRRWAGMQSEMNAAETTAIYNLKNKIERCISILSRTLPAYVRALSRCDEMMSYLDLGVPNMAAASRAAVSSSESLDNEEADDNA